MLTQYSPEEIYKILQGLPQSLRSMATSDEFLEIIERISERYKIDYPSVLSTIVTHVLMGLLSPEDLPKVLKSELKVKNDAAKKIAHEIRRFILTPVKSELTELYHYEFTTIEKPVETTQKTTEEKPEAAPPTAAPGQDMYREQIE